MPMRTVARLNKAYNQAFVEHFDDRSSYVFFSDTHRGDGSLSDEFARNKSIYLYALNFYFHFGYTLVEVGDGDEIWERPKFEYIHFAHSEVYSVMRNFFEEDRLVLLYGNHNIQLRNAEYRRRHLDSVYDPYIDEEIPLFPGISVDEALVLHHDPTGKDILVVHGNQGDLMNDHLWFVSMVFLRYLWRFMHVVGFQNPTSPARNISKTHKIEKAFGRWLTRTNKMLICGHTHMHRFSGPKQLPYFNTGCGILPSGITAIEITDGQIMLVEWKIRAEKDGCLRIARSILSGPVPIADYDT